MTENALACKVNGNVPLGYVPLEDGHYQIDSTYAPIIIEIYDMYRSGMTMKEIVNELKQEVFATGNVANNILKNRRYLGEYIFRDIVIPNGITRIVSQELFDRVQECRKTNKKAPARHKAEAEFFLSTKLFCGKCRRMMAGESGKHRNEATKKEMDKLETRKFELSIQIANENLPNLLLQESSSSVRLNIFACSTQTSLNTKSILGFL